MQPNSRRTDIDLIRGFAMTMIVVTHVASVTLTPGYCKPLGLFIGSAALFFMTSGALNLPVNTSPANFYRRRLPVICVTFVVWSAAYAVLNSLDPTYPRTLAQQLEWLIIIPTWGPGWFVYALIGIYLAMPVISPWLRQATPRQLNWLITAWLISGLMPFIALHPNVEPSISVLAPFAGFLGYAVAGYWLERKTVRSLTLASLTVIGVIFGVKFYITGLRYGWETTMTDDLSVNVMCANIAIFALLKAWRNVPAVILRPMSIVSRYSLGIYLSHWLIIEYVVEPLHLNFFVAFIITMAAATAIGYVQHAITQRLPVAQKPIF